MNAADSSTPISPVMTHALDLIRASVARPLPPKMLGVNTERVIRAIERTVLEPLTPIETLIATLAVRYAVAQLDAVDLDGRRAVNQAIDDALTGVELRSTCRVNHSEPEDRAPFCVVCNGVDGCEPTCPLAELTADHLLSLYFVALRGGR
jgi:hypothetical protein